jgi:hypothetical protein
MAGYQRCGRTNSSETPLYRSVDRFIAAGVLSPGLTHHPVALGAQLIDFGEHPAPDIYPLDM